MHALPSSIEAALAEAGFTATEILIVQRLVQEPAVTLRQLAAKTGKSTGVLDQAMKKLLRKRIVHRETINDTPKYTLNSLASVSQWILQDVQAKRDALLRRYQNFESFMATLASDKARPDMRYFEGAEGMQQAYMKLLESGEELRAYVPAACMEGEDDLREFRTQFFRARQTRHVFTRCIAHDSLTGRRYAGRDAFEYRQTALVPPEACPIAFEKILCGDVVACFDHGEQHVCFIRYPEFARLESEVFETVWKAYAHRHLPALTAAPVIPWRTRVLSHLREAFLSPQSLLLCICFALVAGAGTYGVYRHTLAVIREQKGQVLMEAAADAAKRIAAQDVESVRRPGDMRTAAYQRIYQVINGVRIGRSSVRYAYVWRPTAEEGIWEFVADADTNFFLPSQTDYNGDGALTEDEENPAPGVSYDVSANPNGPPPFQPYVEEDFSADQWGTFLTAGAPILDAEGVPVAVLSLDEDVTSVYRATRARFIPGLWFAGILASFLLLRLCHVLLAKELWVEKIDKKIK